MMTLINIRLALATIRGAKIRSVLTMIAVIIGVASYVVISSTGEGLKASVNEQINELGGNLVTITPGQSIIRDDEGNIESFDFTAAFGASTLTETDLKTVAEAEGVKAAAPQMIVSGVVSRNDAELTGGFILATNQDYPAAFNQTVANGAFFDDSKSQSNVVVIGAGVVEDLFAGTVSLGSNITIRKESFTIIGVMEEFSQSGLNFGPDINKAVLIPFETGKKFNGGAALIQEIDVQLADDADTNVVVDDIKASLLDNHGGEEDFTVIKQDEILDLTGNIFDILTNASRWLSFIMLFVGMVVILLIMLISVTARTREIGIRKSIGATNGNILVQFLTEAVVLTWVGAIIGIAAGVGLGQVLQLTADLNQAYLLRDIVTILVYSTVFGALAGIIPAYLAAKKDPVEALRHD